MTELSAPLRCRPAIGRGRLAELPSREQPLHRSFAERYQSVIDTNVQEPANLHSG